MAKKDKPAEVEKCHPASHSWRLWTYDPVRWPAYAELGCKVCMHTQWFIMSNPPAGYAEWAKKHAELLSPSH